MKAVLIALTVVLSLNCNVSGFSLLHRFFTTCNNINEHCFGKSDSRALSPHLSPLQYTRGCMRAHQEGASEEESDDQFQVLGDDFFCPRDVCVILLAGGAGSRMGEQSIPKQFLPLAGKAILEYSLDLFVNKMKVRKLVLVIDELYTNTYKNGKWRNKKDSTTGEDIIMFATPGVDRQGSVRNGLRCCMDAAAASTSSDSMRTEKIEFVAIHDSARPLVTSFEVMKVISDAKVHGAAVLGVPCKATIKEINVSDDDAESAFVSRTIPRERLWEIHTPQVIAIDTLNKGFEKVEREKLSVTDDASIIEALGKKVKLTRGEYTNLKITTKDDLEIAEGILRARSKQERQG
jgi:2-C-methyl-D-erythritol 4-phosphate cytidylyltransferase